MKYLVIENHGEVEPAAFALMGASTKRGSDGQIGMFGTGTKYAIATLLEGNVQPLILSGGVKIKFGLQIAALKGQRFEQVVMQVGNKQTPLNFTTSMGLHWNVGHALRELVSNAIDEGGFQIGTYEGLPAAQMGKTRIYVPFNNPHVQDFWQNFGNWFVVAGRKPIWEKEYGGKVRVFEPIGEGIRVYRRGCLVYSDKKYNATFDYDIPFLNVKEDRTVDKYDVQRYVHYVLNMMPTELKFRAIKHVAEKPGTSIESEGNPEWNCTAEDWKDSIGDGFVASKSLVAAHPNLLNVPGVIMLPDAWATALEKVGCKSAKDLFTTAQSKGYTVLPREEWDVAHAATFANCMNLLQEAGLFDPTNTPTFEMFTGGETAQKSTWGEYVAKEDKVLMNVECFRQGQRQVFEMLMEELWHRYTGHFDCTREFQTSIFKGWADTIGRLLGKAI